MEFLRRTRNVEESWLRTRLVKCSFKNRNFRNSTRKLTNSIWSSRQIVRTPISNRTSRKKLSRKRGCFRAGRFFPLTWQQTNKQRARLRARSGHACSCLILNRKLSVARKESTKCRRQSSGCSLAKQELPRAFFRSLLFNLFLLLSLNRLEILGRVHVLDSRILLTAETKKFVWTKF